MSPAEAARAEATRSRAALAAVPDPGTSAPERVPAARARRGHRLRVLPGGLPSGAPLRQFGWVLLALVVVSVFGVVAFQAIVVQDQYRLDELQSQILTEQDRAEVLRLEATQLRSPERIEREATERLGLVAPPEIVYLQHDDGDDARAAYDPAEPAPGTTIPPTSGIGQPDPSSTTVPSAGAATDGAAG